ncbi:MAG: cytochrome c3 family protein [Dissulfurispiraceae bacterium]
MMPKWTKTVLLLIFLIAAGCSKQNVSPDKTGNVPSSSDRTYRILSFFIDGLAPPQKKNTGATAAPEAPGSKKELSTYREHGPYAANLCGACHVQTGSNELIMPVEELCQYCHNLNLKKKKVHGPVVAGGCRVCHDPHGSPYRFFLVSESKDFCYQCHSRVDIEKREVHRKTDAGCTYCHNAHAADNEFLLRPEQVGK